MSKKKPLVETEREADLWDDGFKEGRKQALGEVFDELRWIIRHKKKTFTLKNIKSLEAKLKEVEK